mmetsp:Transcript_89721/g.290318  ORF Transcript_89721/g.290318 Transcript_89721/m.290318 type:complete len:212 (+) Transcript_89721:988-1623(+)
MPGLAAAQLRPQSRASGGTRQPGSGWRMPSSPSSACCLPGVVASGMWGGRLGVRALSAVMQMLRAAAPAAGSGGKRRSAEAGVVVDPRRCPCPPEGAPCSMSGRRRLLPMLQPLSPWRRRRRRRKRTRTGTSAVAAARRALAAPQRVAERSARPSGQAGAQPAAQRRRRPWRRRTTRPGAGGRGRRRMQTAALPAARRGRGASRRRECQGL